MVSSKVTSFADVVAGRQYSSVNIGTDKLSPVASVLAVKIPSQLPSTSSAASSRISARRKNSQGLTFERNESERVSLSKIENASPTNGEVPLFIQTNQSKASRAQLKKPSLTSIYYAKKKAHILTSPKARATPETKVATPFLPSVTPIMAFSDATSLQEAASNGNSSTPGCFGSEEEFISKAVFDKRNEIISSTMNLLFKIITQLMRKLPETAYANRLLAFANSLSL